MSELPEPDQSLASADADLATDTRDVLAAFVDLVQSSDRYPTVDSLGDARTIECLKYAAGQVAPRPNPAGVELSRLHLGPNDVLIARMARDSTPAHAAEAAERLSAHDVNAIVLGPQVESVTTRTEAAGRIIITWPSPAAAGVLSSWPVTIHDADTGEQILTAVKIAIVMGADDGYEGALIEADLTLLVDEDGNRIDGGTDSVNRAMGPDGLRTGVFRFLVAEMRVAGQDVKTINEQREDLGLAAVGIP